MMQTSPINDITGCRNLPSPCGAAVRIISLAENPDVTVNQASEALQLDAALTARVMRLANSPLLGHRRRIETLSQAINLLGLHATLQIALGFCLLRGVSPAQDKNPVHDRAWRRSILSGLAARELGQHLQLKKTDELFLCGLLQDIGLLALLQTQEVSYSDLFSDNPTKQVIVEREHTTLGTTHAQVGKRLASDWNLPRSIVEAIAHSEDSEPSADAFLRCIQASGHVADVWLGDDTIERRLAADEALARLTGINAETIDNILLRIQTYLPEIDALLDTRIQTPQHISQLMQEAQEVKLLRQLRNTQVTDDLHQQTLELQQRAIELAEESRKDPLTRLTNRRHLEMALEEAHRMSRISSHPLSVAFIDLDDFKKINDQHGHLTGDKVLVEFAELLSAQLRTSDIVARFGGEEFVVVFPQTPLTTATQVIRRVLNLIGNTTITGSHGTSLKVTFSAGVASHGEEEHFDTAEDLLRAADDALYRSKHLGRNQVHSRRDLSLQNPA